MKSKYIYPAIICITAFFFSSCQQDLEFDGSKTEPVMVVNSFVMPNSLVKVHLSESRFFLNNADSFNIISDAEVYVYRNDEQVEKLNYTAGGFYHSSTFTPSAGDNIKITASNSRFGPVEASTNVVEAVPIQSMEASNFKKEIYYSIYPYYPDGEKMDTLGYSINWTFDAAVRFSDPQAAQNFYRLVLFTNYYYSDGSTEKTPVYFYVSDALAGTASPMDDFFDSGYADPYNQFADDMYNGREISLKIPAHYSYYKKIKDYVPPGYEPPYGEEEEQPAECEIVRIELEADLQSLSRDYYLYLKTRYESESSDLIGGLFSEPVQVYSNVKNGIGILGGYTSSTYILELPIKPID